MLKLIFRPYIELDIVSKMEYESNNKQFNKDCLQISFNVIFIKIIQNQIISFLNFIPKFIKDLE